ncbi:hypothetical protein PENTCL1PPCAC_19074, partial [Pristionchus entomophagus]
IKLINVIKILIANRNKPLYSSFFFRVSISQALFDLTFIPCYFACQTSLLIPDLYALLLSTNGSVWPEWAYAFVYYYLYAQTFGVLIISLHRVLTITKPFSAITKFLESLPRPLLHLIHIAVPLPATALIFWGQPPVRYVYNNATRTLARVAQPEAINQNSVIAIAQTTVITAICVGCYGIIFLQKSSITRRSRSDIVLISVSFVLFLCLCLITAYFVILYIVSSTKRLDIIYHLHTVYPLINAAFSYSSPWMLLMTSAETRRRVMGRWHSRTLLGTATVSNTRTTSR